MSAANDAENAFAESIKRLNRALDGLETAIDGRIEGQRDIGEAEAEVQRVNSDRTDLAQSLDASEARAKRLEDTNREVSRRLVNAMETIRTVLDCSAANQ
ncbi:MAG: DUF4164 domain-containing protein [Pseudomonadota bacterium]